MNVSYQKTRGRPFHSDIQGAIGAARGSSWNTLLGNPLRLPPAVASVIGLSLAARLAMANAVDPGYDEAYYWSYARHLDWSYFDHPPMVGWLAAFGPAVTGLINAWTLRLGAVLMFTGALILMYRLTERLFSPRAGFWSVVILTSIPIFSVGYGTFLAPDSGLVFFWLLTLLGLARAFFPRGQGSGVRDQETILSPSAGLGHHHGQAHFLPDAGRRTPDAAPFPDAGRRTPDAVPITIGTLLCIGLGLGGALLSKYHGVFLAGGALIFMLISSRARSLLRSPAMYTAGLLGLLCFAPVLYWNLQHDFASFAFQGVRAFPESSGYDWQRLFGSLGGQMIELTPPVALACWYYLAMNLRWGLGQQAGQRLFLTVFGSLPLLFFTVLAGAAPSFSHWSMPAYLALIPLVADGIAWGMVRKRRTTLALVLASILLTVGSAGVSYLHARFGILQRAEGARHVWIPLIPPQADPSLEMTGWTELGQFLRARGYAQRPNTFFFSHLYYFCGIVSFGLQQQGNVYCFNQGDARAFAFWQDPVAPLGQDGIFICNRRSYRNAVKDYGDYFERVEWLDELPLYRNGVEIERFTLFLGHRLIKPFPFTYGQSAPHRASPAGFRIFHRWPVYL